MTGFARFDPCVNWFRVVARTKGRILWIFPTVLLAAYIGALWRGTPLRDLQAYFHQRRANAPLLTEARALKIDYEQVLAKPAAYVGKPVVWCIDTPVTGNSYVSGRASWAVALNGASGDYLTNSGSAGYCWNVLAVVTGFENGRVQLRPVEKW